MSVLLLEGGAAKLVEALIESLTARLTDIDDALVQGISGAGRRLVEASK